MLADNTIHLHNNKNLGPNIKIDFEKTDKRKEQQNNNA